MTMFLYAGQCRMGRVGDATPFRDMLDKPLFVGDIVMIAADNFGFDGLTAVVSDEFTSYSDGTHVVKEGPVEPFVMGIKSIDLTQPNDWQVVKVKDHADVVHGEHWRAYGFNYRDEGGAA